MPDVAITSNRADIGAAIKEALSAVALEPLVSGKAVEEKMRFPRLALRDAIEAFTLVAYGERLTFEHA
jgi:hypothetical protein